MSNNTDSVQTGYVIDPNFFKPPNVIDLRYLDTGVEGEQDTTPYTEAADDVYPVDTLPPDSDVGATIGIPIPDGVTLISQTVRSVPGGGYLLDIVIDIPDIPGVDGFEVSVAKA